MESLLDNIDLIYRRKIMIQNILQTPQHQPPPQPPPQPQPPPPQQIIKSEDELRNLPNIIRESPEL